MPRDVVFVGGADGGNAELAGLFSKIGKKLKSVLKKAAPIAAGFIPGVGGIVSGAISGYIEQKDAKKAQRQAGQIAAAAAGVPYSEDPGAYDVPEAGGLIPGVSNQALIIGGAVVLGLVLFMPRGRR